MFSLIYNGETPEEHGTYITTRPSIPAPQPRGEFIEVSGVDGAFLDWDGTYDNIEIAVALNFVAPQADAYMARFRELKSWIRDSGELSFSDDPTVFYKVKQATIADNRRINKRGGHLTASFICDPYTYLVEGSYLMTAAEARRNPGNVNCYPEYLINGSGTITLTVNGNEFKVVSTGQAIIDTARRLVTDGGGVSIGATSTGNITDLFLEPGNDNTISISGGTVMVTPNWRYL